MKRLISILLCFVLICSFAGCSEAYDPQAYVPTGDALEGEHVADDAALAEKDEQQEQTLALAYYPDRSMNPLEATDFTNRALMSLLYQGLFAVNENYEVIPLLCKSYTVSSDMMTYEFTLDPKATFSDGTPVKAEDVVTSLLASMQTDYYSGRLRHVDLIAATATDKVQIILSQAYENLPLLLDIPIVKEKQILDPYPLGTGPYVIGRTTSGVFLSRRSNWWCSSDDLLIAANRIDLIKADSTNTIRDAFEFGEVGVVCTDPGSDRYVEYRCDYELWNCETGIFVYLGVNRDSYLFQDRSLRQALSKGIDRRYLVDQFYQGFATAAELPASPNSPFYSETLAQKYAYDADAYQKAMSAVKGFTVRLLVNQSDSFRVRVAQEISRMLSTSGLIVEVVSVSSGDYRVLLAQGEYDLYLGQTKLSPNMNLTPFFSSGGELNYGDIDDVGIYTLCLQALENQGNYYNLHKAVMDEGYLCPVLFRSYAVYAARGLVTSLNPARDNLFCYSIGRTMEDAFTIEAY